MNGANQATLSVYDVTTSFVTPASSITENGVKSAEIIFCNVLISVDEGTQSRVQIKISA